MTRMNSKVDPSKLITKDRDKQKTGQKQRRKHSSLLGGSISGSSTSRTSDHILEISGFSVEPRKNAGRSRRQIGEYGHAPRVIK